MSTSVMWVSGTDRAKGVDSTRFGLYVPPQHSWLWGLLRPLFELYGLPRAPWKLLYTGKVDVR